MNKDNSFSKLENINKATMTPVMKQYLKNKEKFPGAILFFRLGDFYEMFYDDALKASSILDITLTKKNFGKDNDNAPMCGVPYHSADGYIKRLLDAGERVAVCDQMEDATLAKGLVERDVVRIITPGTVFDQELLAPGENNYLCAICCKDNRCGLAYADISTGELFATELKSDDILERIISELSKIGPKEMISSEDVFAYGFAQKIEQITGARLHHFEGIVEAKTARTYVLEKEGKQGLHELGLEVNSLIIPAVYILYEYLQGAALHSDVHLSELRIYSGGDKLLLDGNAIRNLELLHTLGEGKEKGSLISVIGKTATAMGKRLLRSWLTAPLLDVAEINSRHQAVETFIEAPLQMQDLKDLLAQMQDILRYTSKLSYGSAKPRDLVALANSLRLLPDIMEVISGFDGKLDYLIEGIGDFKDLIDLVDRAIIDEPPLHIKDGGFIREGYSESLDEIKASIGDNVEYIKTLEQNERFRTGIKGLKVKFNRVTGYYIELGKAAGTVPPEDYILKQTLMDRERYVTPKLKQVEGVLLGAEAKINSLEQKMFGELVVELAKFTNLLNDTGRAIAKVDVILSFAILSIDMSYVRPIVDEGDKIEIIGGRHPVIEVYSDTKYIANDLYMDMDESSLLLITGPNMAGKSTYMRQTAIIVILAQMGCFVPAKSAHIGICDRIFTRIGASDNIHKGESTFFVEMKELSAIFANATGKSLIILDEIGRGTSTYDGLAIAWATVERLTVGGQRARTMLATHYHELTTLEHEYKGIVNLRTSIINANDQLVFMHKVIKGATGKSYGIQVAKLSGVPAEVISSADQKLKFLGKEKSKLIELLDKGEDEQQISLFALVNETEDSSELSDKNTDNIKAIMDRIADVDLMELTPAAAIELIGDLKELQDD